VADLAELLIFDAMCLPVSRKIMLLIHYVSIGIIGLAYFNIFSSIVWQLRICPYGTRGHKSHYSVWV